MDISLVHISKRYLHKTVLDGVSLFFEGGKIHALLGENGAGKSTTAAILSGSLSADAGRILLDGNEAHFLSPRDAAKAGVVCVHQRPLLANGISVKENILLGAEYGADAQKAKKRDVLRDAERLKRLWLPTLDFRKRVANIGGDGRFYTALISALVKKPRVLILDEPSALLDWEQRRSLYANMRRLANEGMNVIVITHIMQEAALYSDTVTVLRKGKKAEYYEESSRFVPQTYEANLLKSESAELIDETDFVKEAKFNKKVESSVDFRVKRGNDNSDNSDETDAVATEDFISFQGLSVRPKNRPALFDVSFTAAGGGITLIAGLQESGLGTLENAVTGMERERLAGVCVVGAGGKKLSVALQSGKLTPRFLRHNSGLRAAIIPSDRTFRASNPSLSIAQLLCAMHGGTDENAYSQKLIKAAGVAIRPDEKASALSGGMLQRLILARELDGNPRLVIACEPLQGLDRFASMRTVSTLSSLAKQGCVVLVLSSSDFPEEVCASVYALSGGALQKKFPEKAAASKLSNLRADALVRVSAHVDKTSL